MKNDLISREHMKSLGATCIATRSKDGTLFPIVAIDELPSVQPERLTDDDFETIRIHLNAQKEFLCNQHRWEEAEEYQHIIDRFIAFASTQPRNGMWIDIKHTFMTKCSVCDWINNDDSSYNFCPNCGADMRGENE